MMDDRTGGAMVRAMLAGDAIAAEAILDIQEEEGRDILGRDDERRLLEYWGSEKKRQMADSRRWTAR